MATARRLSEKIVTNLFPSSSPFVLKTGFKINFLSLCSCLDRCKIENFPFGAQSFSSAVPFCRLPRFAPAVGTSQCRSPAHSDTGSGCGPFATEPVGAIRRQMSNSHIKASTPPNGPERKMPFMIGVSGGTASGKSTVCEKIMEAVHGSDVGGADHNIVSLSQDSFYRELNEKETLQAKKGFFNFDHPDAFDHELTLSCLKDIRDGKMTKVPVYDFKTNSRVKGEYKIIQPSDVVLFEGILVFYHKDVMEMFSMKLFVDTDADTRLARRVLRDIEERDRDLEHVLNQYMMLVKPAFEEFCLPTKKHADVIIPRGAENTVAISLIVQHIMDILQHTSCKRTSFQLRERRQQRRALMATASLPMGEAAASDSQSSREDEGTEDLNPFGGGTLRPGSSNFQVRPH